MIKPFDWEKEYLRAYAYLKNVATATYFSVQTYLEGGGPCSLWETLQLPLCPQRPKRSWGWKIRR